MKNIFFSFCFLCLLYKTWGQKVDTSQLKALKADTSQLKAIIVRGAKPLFQQQINGTVVNVGNSILTKGSSILEVLERSPGVVIDRRSNAISLNGKNGVLVLVDGKRLRMSMDQLVDLLNSIRTGHPGFIGEQGREAAPARPRPHCLRSRSQGAEAVSATIVVLVLDHCVPMSPKQRSLGRHHGVLAARFAVAVVHH